jgi:sigma-E factor negative regulatory protein RseC
VTGPTPEPLLEEPARVLSLAPGRALVEARRRSACGRCAARSGCGHGLLDSLASRYAIAFELSVPEGLRDALRPGDTVVVGVPERAVLGAALRVYAPPLAGLLAGTLAGGAFLGSDGAAAVGAALGLLAGSVAIGVLDRRAPGPAPRLLRRADAGPDAGADAAIPLKIV